MAEKTGTKQADELYYGLLSDGQAKPEDVLAYFQRHMAVPKGKRNDFGGFNYRSLGDINDALKPLCAEQGCSVTYDDQIQGVGDRVYVMATCRLTTPYGAIETHGWAREALKKTKSDEPQLTGMASTYARKYAAAGLFMLDTETDPDQLPPPEPEPEWPDGEFYARCRSCGQVYGPFTRYTAPVTSCSTCNVSDWEPMPGWRPEGQA